MSFTYAERKKAAPRAQAAPERTEALSRGAVKPTAAEMGHRVDLPDAMRAKMESSFGADFSGVKLYESQAVGDAGAEAITQGSSIAFAPGKLDFSSSGGQALLGHELSHVVSQQRGEVTGGGFLNDHALEARADREGAMAARGESVYGGASAPLSAVSAAPAAGPMQASRKEDPKAKANKTAQRMMAIQMAKGSGMKVTDNDEAFLSGQLKTYNPDVMKALMNSQINDLSTVESESRNFRKSNKKENRDIGRVGISESYDMAHMEAADSLMNAAMENMTDEQRREFRKERNFKKETISRDSKYDLDLRMGMLRNEGRLGSDLVQKTVTGTDKNGFRTFDNSNFGKMAANYGKIKRNRIAKDLKKWR